MKCYEELRAVSDVDEESLLFSAPDAVCVRSSSHTRPTRIEVSKARSPESVASLLRRLRNIQCRFKTGAPKDWNSFVAVLDS